MTETHCKAYAPRIVRKTYRWLNMHTGTRLTPLLLTRGGAPSLLNNAGQSDSLLLPSETTSEPLSYELFELDADVFLFTFFCLTKRHRAR